TVPAADAHVADDAEVLGVFVGGRARAYLVEAMGGVGQKPHLVNDVVGGQAVSVSYCNDTRCARVFTDKDAGSQPLGVTVGGFLESKGMALRIGDVDYLQQTGENLSTPDGPAFPYPELPHERTTWKKWRDAHPDTDIFVGATNDPQKHGKK